MSSGKMHYSARLGEMRSCNAQDSSSCTASRGNEFDVDIPHFDNKQDAENFHNSLLRKKYGNSPVMKKTFTSPRQSFTNPYRVDSRKFDIAEEAISNEIKRDGNFAYISIGAESEMKAPLVHYSDDEINKMRMVASSTAEAAHQGYSQYTLSPDIADKIVARFRSVGMGKEVNEAIQKAKESEDYGTFSKELTIVAQKAQLRYKDMLVGYEVGTSEKVKIMQKEEESKMKGGIFARLKKKITS